MSMSDCCRANRGQIVCPGCGEVENKKSREEQEDDIWIQLVREEDERAAERTKRKQPPTTFAVVTPVGTRNSHGEYDEFYGWDTKGHAWLYSFRREGWQWGRAEGLDHPESI